MDTIRYFSMFSGIGGFELGLQNSKHNFENVGWSEIDRYASSIYSRHFPRHRCYGDATEIDTGELEDFEFLVGGFPCQTFSIAGKRKGFHDTRGTLFFELARILKDKKPPYFLFENVTGLLSHQGGETFQTILEVIDELGYNVQWQVYNSKDYGVPQSRKRVFIKGYLRGRCGGKVLFIPRVSRTVDAPVSRTHWGVRSGRIHRDDEHMNCLTEGGKNSGGRQLIQLNDAKGQAEKIYSTDGVSVALMSNSGGLGGKTGLYKINKVGGVNNGQGGDIFSPDGISPCLCSGDLSHNGGINIVEDCDVKDYRIRKLTPVECERLQGFPDNWTQYGVDDELISNTQRYKCCGNAVTTTVITAIVDEMFDEIRE